MQRRVPELVGTADERRELRRSGKTIIDRGTFGFTDNHQYQVAFENGRDFRFIKVEDESVARAIEAVVKRLESAMITSARSDSEPVVTTDAIIGRGKLTVQKRGSNRMIGDDFCCRRVSHNQ